MKWLPLALLASTLALAPLAAAEYYEGKPECPPDQVCTTSAGGFEEDPAEDANRTEGTFGPDDCVDCMRPPGDDGPTHDGECGGEVCAYDSPSDGASNCMDGAEAGETCRDDVQYIGGPSEGSGNAEADPAGASDPDALKEAPALGAALALAAAGVAVALAAVRRR